MTLFERFSNQWIRNWIFTSVCYLSASCDAFQILLNQCLISWVKMAQKSVLSLAKLNEYVLLCWLNYLWILNLFDFETSAVYFIHVSWVENEKLEFLCTYSRIQNKYTSIKTVRSRRKVREVLSFISFLQLAKVQQQRQLLQRQQISSIYFIA